VLLAAAESVSAAASLGGRPVLSSLVMVPAESALAALGPGRPRSLSILMAPAESAPAAASSGGRPVGGASVLVSGGASLKPEAIPASVPAVTEALLLMAPAESAPAAVSSGGRPVLSSLMAPAERVPAAARAARAVAWVGRAARGRRLRARLGRRVAEAGSDTSLRASRDRGVALDGACRERASGRVVGRAARALELDGACRESASGRVAARAARAVAWLLVARVAAVLLEPGRVDAPPAWRVVLVGAAIARRVRRKARLNLDVLDRLALGAGDVVRGASSAAVSECLRAFPDGPRTRNDAGFLSHHLALELGNGACRERASGRGAEQAALALDLDGACREHASGRAAGRAARALQLGCACRDRASGRAAAPALQLACRERASGRVAGRAAGGEREAAGLLVLVGLVRDIVGLLCSGPIGAPPAWRVLAVGREAALQCVASKGDLVRRDFAHPPRRHTGCRESTRRGM